jgi:PAS domain S-box-containing protein
MKLNFVVILILFASIGLCQNPPLTFSQLSIKDGLAQSTVYCLHLDSKGFLWIGTQDGGVNKFDGYNFKIFDQNPNVINSISSNSISDICEDRSGNLWIATWGGGLNRFDVETEKFKQYKYNPNDSTSIGNNRVQSLYIDNIGELWIGTSGGGLCLYQPKDDNFIRYQHDPENVLSISNNRVWDILQDKENRYWIATSNGINLFYPKTGKFARYLSTNNKSDISHPEVRSLFVDSKGTLWLGTSWGLNKFNYEKSSFKRYIPFPNDPPKLYTNEINCFFEYENELWIGTHNGGLCIFNIDDETFRIYQNVDDDPGSLSYNDIRDMCLDNSGNLWLATRGGGINKIDLKPKKFQHFYRKTKRENSLSSNRVEAIIVDKDSIVWIGTNGGGLNKYNPVTGKFTHYLSELGNPNTIGSNHIRCIIEDENETIWIGTNGSGLNKFDKKTELFKAYMRIPRKDSSISDNDVMAISLDDENNLWLGTDKGLNLFYKEEEVFIRYFYNQDDTTSISDDRIYSLYNDHLGTLWVGTDNGLNQYIKETNSFVRYNNIPGNPTSISNNDIYAIYNDVFGNLWIGTGRGLNKYQRETKSFKSYNKEEGLSGSAIMGILDDSNGNLWISTIKGLSRFDSKTETFRNYDELDGLQSNEFTIGACSKGLEGELYFGGIEGYNVFYPDRIKDNVFVPPVVITKMEIGHKELSHQTSEILEKTITYSEKIVLDYSQNMFSFEFAALNYTIPEKNQYKCKLEGFDKEWNYIGTRRFISYTNIPPGNYMFKVMATNNDGLWNKDGKTLQIIIKPPFWRTSVFIIGLLIVIISVIYLYIRLRERRLKHDKKILEHKVKIRTTELLQKQEEILAQSEELEKLSIVARETDNAVIIADQNGDIEWLNEGFTRLLGFEIDEFVKIQGGNLINEESPAEAKRSFKRCIEQKVSVVYNYRTYSKDENEIWLQSTITPILNNEENIFKFVVILVDITKLKIAEEEIEEQRNEIEAQRDKIAERNTEIRDSIQYASRIQRALLPLDTQIGELFTDHFVLNIPRDIVSGDFYWISTKGYKTIVAVADCTGHGVPGAFMSMLGLAFINDILNSSTVIHANNILNELRQKIIKALHQIGTPGEANDGMDIALCVIDHENMDLEFSGAFNPLYFIRNEELIEFEGDKMPISIHSQADQAFTNKFEELEKNDMLYLFSDGFADQFGGKKGRKFMVKRFKKTIQEISHFPCDVQRTKLLKTYEDWRGNEEQVDDILVLGIRI